jgi:2-hydroxy-3-oxopropionate reductase
VSGGQLGAKGATLTIMVGGNDATFAKVKPVFELMGKNITLVGANGAGQITKVANQIIVALILKQLLKHWSLHLRLAPIPPKFAKH